MLTHKELEQIDRNLDAFADDDDPPALSMVDGAITAAICSPELIKPSEMIKIIIGEGDNEDGFKSEKHAEKFVQGIMKLNNSIVEDLEAGSLAPIATESPELPDAPDYQVWCLGFLMTYVKFEDRFKKGGEEVENLLNVIYEWADLHNNSSFHKTSAEEKRNVITELEDELRNNVVELYWYWRENDMLEEGSMSVN